MESQITEERINLTLGSENDNHEASPSSEVILGSNVCSAVGRTACSGCVSKNCETCRFNKMVRDNFSGGEIIRVESYLGNFGPKLTEDNPLELSNSSGDFDDINNGMQLEGEVSLGSDIAINNSDDDSGEKPEQMDKKETEPHSYLPQLFDDSIEVVVADIFKKSKESSESQEMKKSKVSSKKIKEKESDILEPVKQTEPEPDKKTITTNSIIKKASKTRAAKPVRAIKKESKNTEEPQVPKPNQFTKKTNIDKKKTRKTKESVIEKEPIQREAPVVIEKNIDAKTEIVDSKPEMVVHKKSEKVKKPEKVSNRSEIISEKKEIKSKVSVEKPRPVSELKEKTDVVAQDIKKEFFENEVVFIPKNNHKKTWFVNEPILEDIVTRQVEKNEKDHNDDEIKQDDSEDIIDILEFKNIEPEDAFCGYLKIPKNEDEDIDYKNDQIADTSNHIDSDTNDLLLLSTEDKNNEKILVRLISFIFDILSVAVI